MNIKRDTKNQPYIEWEQGNGTGGYKRAWIQHKEGSEKDWATQLTFLFSTESSQMNRFSRPS
jgi:hypothetical protein